MQAEASQCTAGKITPRKPKITEILTCINNLKSCVMWVYFVSPSCDIIFNNFLKEKKGGPADTCRY